MPALPFVVKNGSKTRERTSSAMPVPVSATAISTESPSSRVEQELIDRDGLEVVVAPLAREVLDALDGLRPVLRRLDDELQPRLDPLGVFRRQQELRAPEDAGERVVEVVRHARGQLA